MYNLVKCVNSNSLNIGIIDYAKKFLSPLYNDLPRSASSESTTSYPIYANANNQQPNSFGVTNYANQTCNSNHSFYANTSNNESDNSSIYANVSPSINQSPNSTIPVPNDGFKLSEVLEIIGAPYFKGDIKVQSVNWNTILESQANDGQYFVRFSGMDRNFALTGIFLQFHLYLFLKIYNVVKLKTKDV